MKFATLVKQNMHDQVIIQIKMVKNLISHHFLKLILILSSVVSIFYPYLIVSTSFSMHHNRIDRQDNITCLIN